MSDPGSRPVFLKRSGYRRRRLADAAFLLPILGIMLFAVPLLWPTSPPQQDAPQHAVTMSDAILYIFGVWVLLILLAALFGIRARQWALDSQEPGAR